jgi:hypothetical protein
LFLTIQDLGIDLSVDIGYYHTTKELFRTLLFHIVKNTDKENMTDWDLSDDITMWPKFLQALCFLSPVIESKKM